METIKAELERIEKKGQTLLANCKEFEAMASDEEERDRVVSTESQISAFIKTCSWKQTIVISSEIDKLIKLHAEYENALNKFEVRQDLMRLIKSIEDKLSLNKSVLEDYWLTLTKKSAAF